MTVKQEPREAQAFRVRRILSETTKAALIGDEPGVGKTLVGVETVLQGGLKRVLVVAPKDTYSQWADRFAAQSDGAAVLRRIDASKAGKAALADFLAGSDGLFFSGSQMLVSKDWAHEPILYGDGSPMLHEKTGKPLSKPVRLHTYEKMRPLDMFLFDEVHVLQNRKSRGKATMSSIKSEWKIGMSGTPYGNSFPGIWSVCRWLWPTITDAAYSRFVAEWCVTETVYVAGGKAQQTVTGEVNPGEFVAQLPCYIRSEAAEQTPPAKVVMVSLSPEQRADYTALEDDLMVWLEGHKGLAPLVADIPITLRARLRTATLGVMSLNENDEIFFDINTKSTKLDALSGLLRHYGAQPVIIGVDSKRFAKVTVARMKAGGLSVAEWSGDVSSKGRDAIKAAFMAGELQYIVSVIPSMSTGLDGFQTVCSKAIWLSESDDNIQNTQWIARLFRPGRTMKYGEFEHVRILAHDTLDAGIFNKKIMETFLNMETLRAA